MGAGTNSYGWNAQRLSNVLRFSEGYALQNQTETTEVFKFESLCAKAFCCAFFSSLYEVASKLVDGLGSEPDVTHDRDTGEGDILDHIFVPINTFDLDCMGARLHQTFNTHHGIPQALANGEKWHICDYKRVRCSSSDSPNMQSHHVGCSR